jgi:hypothetical protein
VLEPAEGGGVNDAVAIAAEGVAASIVICSSGLQLTSAWPALN